MLPWLTTVALAAPPDFSFPNSLLGISAGSPTMLSVRGEAWFSARGTLEVGGGVPLATLESWLDGQTNSGLPATFDAALRWRPRGLCFGCGERALATFGIGIGTIVTPDLDVMGPWTYAVGLDLVATGVVWSSPMMGWHLSLRGGGGPEWVGRDWREPEPAFWAFGTLGFAF